MSYFERIQRSMQPLAPPGPAASAPAGLDVGFEERTLQSPEVSAPMPSTQALFDEVIHASPGSASTDEAIIRSTPRREEVAEQRQHPDRATTPTTGDVLAPPEIQVDQRSEPLETTTGKTAPRMPDPLSPSKEHVVDKPRVVAATPSEPQVGMQQNVAAQDVVRAELHGDDVGNPVVEVEEAQPLLPVHPLVTTLERVQAWISTPSAASEDASTNLMPMKRDSTAPASVDHGPRPQGVEPIAQGEAWPHFPTHDREAPPQKLRSSQQAANVSGISIGAIHVTVEAVPDSDLLEAQGEPAVQPGSVANPQTARPFRDTRLARHYLKRR